MKRDMELVRKILLLAESVENQPTPIAVDGYSDEPLAYHVAMLTEAKFLNKGSIIYDARGAVLYGQALSFAGHDFLDTVRDDTVWRKTIEKVGSTLGTASLDIIKSVAESYAKQLLGIP